MQFNLNTNEILKKDGVSFVIPFFLITGCFAMWGFANDMTGPIVKAFSKIFRMSVTEGSFVQVAYYLGYFAMAFPAALFIQRYSYKAGVLLGLSLFAIGALLFIPAKMIGYYYPFLMAYFIMTCGLSFLETSCNPYIYCMGTEETATQRLNLAQAFNPIGALSGMWVAKDLVMARMSPMTTSQRSDLSLLQFNLLKDHDLSILIQPYIFLGVFCIILLLLIRLYKMPMDGDDATPKSLMLSINELLHIRNYREGVIAQFFYVGAQVTCWTFIIQYGTRVFMAEGMDEKAAEILSQKYNIYAMLSILAIIAIALVTGVILFPDRNGVYCLVGVSACMSLMFPTIYGIALRGVGDNVKFAGAGLIMAILGGSVFPPIQALIIDCNISLFGISSTNYSFIVPFICFIVVAIYGHRAFVRHFIYKTNN